MVVVSLSSFPRWKWKARLGKQLIKGDGNKSNENRETIRHKRTRSRKVRKSRRRGRKS